MGDRWAMVPYMQKNVRFTATIFFGRILFDLNFSKCLHCSSKSEIHEIGGMFPLFHVSISNTIIITQLGQDHNKWYSCIFYENIEGKPRSLSEGTVYPWSVECYPFNRVIEDHEGGGGCCVTTKCSGKHFCKSDRHETAFITVWHSRHTYTSTFNQRMLLFNAFQRCVNVE